MGAYLLDQLLVTPQLTMGLALRRTGYSFDVLGNGEDLVPFRRLMGSVRGRIFSVMNGFCFFQGYPLFRYFRIFTMCYIQFSFFQFNRLTFSVSRSLWRWWQLRRQRSARRLANSVRGVC